MYKPTSVIAGATLHSISAKLRPCVPVIIGLVAVCAPTFTVLRTGVWVTEMNAYDPIVMVVAFVFMFFLVRQMRTRELIEQSSAPNVDGLLLHEVHDPMASFICRCNDTAANQLVGSLHAGNPLQSAKAS